MPWQQYRANTIEERSVDLKDMTLALGHWIQRRDRLPQFLSLATPGQFNFGPRTFGIEESPA